MFYSCAKISAFKLPDLVEFPPSGGVVAAAAMPCGQLKRRSFTKFPHLRHRMFDPQMYLAGLDPNTAASTIFKLGTYDWFGVQLDEYESAVHGSHLRYKASTMDEVLAKWSGVAPYEPKEIQKCVNAALNFQIQIGCEALIAPTPLTIQNSYEIESLYLDAAARFVKDAQVGIPLLASVVVSDGIFRNLPPTANNFIDAVTGHITARSEFSGAYLTIDQTVDTGYVCQNESVLLSLLLITDDLVRGAGKRVVVNYLGHFGLVLMAAGASIWSSGYYRSQRRMRLADQEEQEGRAYPRLFSGGLAGDIGAENDIQELFRTTLFSKVFNHTRASDPLLRALKARLPPSSAPEWKYGQGNISAAAAHYLDVCSRLDAHFDGFSFEDKVEATGKWLSNAVGYAREASRYLDGRHTELKHQAIWEGAFKKWREFAQV